MGYTRIEARSRTWAIVGRSTLRRILKTAALPPVPQRPTPWQTFLRAHRAPLPALISSRQRLIAGLPVIDRTNRVRRHARLGGLFNFYERAA
jgi:hypothetical protein